MLALLIENCTERGIVAIVENGSCIYLAGLPFGSYNSKFLLPKISEGLHRIEKTPKDFDFIVAGVGPGSYTGIRIGAIVAKTLSYSSQVPLVGVSTLKGFIPDQDASFIAILDAKMAGCYVIKGEKRGEAVTYTSEPRLVEMENLQKALEGAEVLVSPQSLSLQQKFEKMYPGNKWRWEETTPDPIHMTQIAEEKFRDGVFSIDGSLEILYLREVGQ